MVFYFIFNYFLFYEPTIDEIKNHYQHYFINKSSYLYTYIEFNIDAAFTRNSNSIRIIGFELV